MSKYSNVISTIFCSIFIVFGTVVCMILIEEKQNIAVICWEIIVIEYIILLGYLAYKNQKTIRELNDYILYKLSTSSMYKKSLEELGYIELAKDIVLYKLVLGNFIGQATGFINNKPFYSIMSGNHFSLRIGETESEARIGTLAQYEIEYQFTTTEDIFKELILSTAQKHLKKD